MGRITLEQAAAWCGGSVEKKYKDIEFFGASNDTRSLKKGQLFIALQGQRDGHAYIPAAMEKGAAAVLCTHREGDYPAIVVADPRTALGDIARGERNRLNMKVVGITGSVGKSTTKEMAACVLETTFRVGKSPANHNNDIGMPMAILAMPDDTQVAVLEMGMNHFREMAYLSAIAQPDIAVIVNIGTMHIEHLGSREGILKAKLEILEGMKSESTIILNGDDPMLWGIRPRVSRCAYFGVENQEVLVHGSEVKVDRGFISFHVDYRDIHFPMELPVEGDHFVDDALAAICVGIALGVHPKDIQQSLSQFQNMAGRQEILKEKDMTIIKDCYNAGPESMAAALNVLGNQAGRKIAVLGDMLELGVCTQAEHYRVGRIAAEKADYLLSFGPNSSRVLDGATTGGMVGGRARAFEDRSELVQALKRLAKPGDVLLFKGSRGMHMELALEQFLAEEK